MKPAASAKQAGKSQAKDAPKPASSASSKASAKSKSVKPAIAQPVKNSKLSPKATSAPKTVTTKAANKTNKKPSSGARLQLDEAKEMELLGVDQMIQTNAANMIDIQAKVKMIEATLLKQASPKCDENCAKNQAKEAQKLVAEVQSPLHEVTSNCQTNFETYTNSFMPDAEHVQLMTREVMNVEGMMNQVKDFHAQLGSSASPDFEADLKSLLSLKSEMGISSDDHIYFEKK